MSDNFHLHLSSSSSPHIWLPQQTPPVFPSDYDSSPHHPLHPSHPGWHGSGALHLHLLSLTLQPDVHRPSHPPPHLCHPHPHRHPTHLWPPHHHRQRASKLLPHHYFLRPPASLPPTLNLLQELCVWRGVPVLCSSDAALHLLQDHADSTSCLNGPGLCEQSEKYCHASWGAGLCFYTQINSSYGWSLYCNKVKCSSWPRPIEIHNMDSSFLK